MRERPDRVPHHEPDIRHRRRTAVAWIAVAATASMTAIALLGLAGTTADGRPLVLAATVVGAAAGVGAAWLITIGRIRVAGLLLVLAIVTPTFAAAAINVVALALGIVLLVDSFRTDGAFHDPVASPA
jgi:hypothetical protein